MSNKPASPVSSCGNVSYDEKCRQRFPCRPHAE
jgi:hypothetical protein